MLYEIHHSTLSNEAILWHSTNLNFPAHIHSSFEIIVATKGEAEVTVGENKYTIRGNECILVFPNQFHQIKTAEHSELAILIFPQHLVKAFSQSCEDYVPKNNKFNLDSFFINRIINFEKYKATIELKGLLYSICSEFNSTAEYIKSKNNNALIFKIFNFVSENYKKECSLRELAKEINYNYVYLSQHFLKVIGISFSEYVCRYRINEACYLLTNTNRTVLDIAGECGFDCLRSFNRNFKSIMGVTPTKYRNRDYNIYQGENIDLQSLLNKMTLKEKCYQLQQVNSNIFMADENMPITGPEFYLQFDKNYKYDVASVYNSYGAKRNMAIQKDVLENSKNKIPLAFMLDVIHGYRTIYPINLGLASSFDRKLVRECCQMAAKEASVDGIHLTFAPMLDVSRDARWGRCMESCGEDTYLTCEMARESVLGYQGDRGKYTIGASVKHIAGYSAPMSGKDYDSSDISELTLREVYLPPYKAAVDAGAMVAMPAQNVMNGVPGNGNSFILKNILRNEWFFDGVTISDYGSIENQVSHGYCESKRDATLESLNAEIDMEMVSTCYINNIEALLNEGKITMKQVDTAVMRVLKLKEKLGLFENPYKCMDTEEAKKILGCKEHREIAKRSAMESAVLLKNNGVLPFNKNVKRVAVIGPHGDEKRIVGAWWCAYKPEETVTVLEGVKSYLSDTEVVFSKGCNLDLNSTDYSEIDTAVELAKNSDSVILCVGEDQCDSGESNSKSNLHLPSVQVELIKRVCEVNKNTVLVLFTGRPLVITDIESHVGAILNMYFPGTEGGNAIAELVFGECSPSGKLTMSFPRNEGQCPIYYNHHRTANLRSDDNKRILYESGYIDSPNSPLYPFGYGLSYSTFEYSDFKLSDKTLTNDTEIIASVKVKNTGKYKAKEAVQLYIRDLVGSVVRPIKELKGFEKIELLPNEEKIVEFTINEKLLKFIKRDLTYGAEEGDFQVFIGKDSRCQHFDEFKLIKKNP